MTWNHFFFFRHCVRSTVFDIDLRDDSRNGSRYPTDPTFYFGASLPEWQVPENWCTESAINLVENAGYWLIASNFVDQDLIDGDHEIQIEFLSDASHRDIDTAYALSRGITKACIATNTSCSFQKQIGYDEQVFKPTVSSRYAPNAVCADQVRTIDLIQEVQKRLNGTVPPPDPPYHEALQEMIALVGTGEGDGSQWPDDIPIDITIADDGYHLAGAVNLLKAVGELLLYSRAGGIHPPFAPNATIPQVYRFLQWNHWYRSVVSVGNSHAATNGAFIARILLHVLEHGRYQHDRDDSGVLTPLISKQKHRVCIIVGHDGDLDAIATALDVQWELQEPYLSGSQGAYLPTPPMSGFHAARNVKNDEIRLSFLYPIFSTTRVKWVTNTSGILERTPVLFNPDVDMVYFPDEKWTAIRADRGRGSLSILRAHIEQVISRYTGAMDCFQSAERFIVTAEQSSFLSELPAGNSPFYPFLGGVISTVLLCCVGALLRRCCCQRRNDRTYTYGSMQLPTTGRGHSGQSDDELI